MAFKKIFWILLMLSLIIPIVNGLIEQPKLSFFNVTDEYEDLYDIVTLDATLQVEIPHSRDSGQDCSDLIFYFKSDEKDDCSSRKLFENCVDSNSYVVEGNNKLCRIKLRDIFDCQRGCSHINVPTDKKWIAEVSWYQDKGIGDRKEFTLVTKTNLDNKKELWKNKYYGKPTAIIGTILIILGTIFGVIGGFRPKKKKIKLLIVGASSVIIGTIILNIPYFL